jgi:hypothetical protein
VGQTEFKRYPENLLNSRVRYGRAFQVRRRGCSSPPGQLVPPGRPQLRASPA